MKKWKRELKQDMKCIDRKCISISTVCFMYQITMTDIANNLDKISINHLKNWIETNILADKERRNVKDLLERLDKSFAELTMFDSKTIEITFIDPLSNENIVVAKEKLKNDHEI